jgi:POT family proton-dependent oligopeptide transporter
MPPGIAYIVGNEAAERFSFYGMKAILTVFMYKYLWLMDDVPGIPMSRASASEYQHLFTFAVYFTPLAGALIADIWFGKYRTIIALSLVYCFGHACLAAMGIAGPAKWWLIMGLGWICIGSGGIKPCVSAHVGDQFGRSNRHLMTRVFNYFYWSINLGAFLSTMLTPWLLEWYGPHWAFGVPGVLMALATLMFWLGRRKFAHIPPGGKKFVKELFSGHGLAALGKLCVIYVFIAVFWSLFDQTASSWVIQADDMDKNFLGREWLPSQVQALNPIFVLTFIPLFTFVVYPLIDKMFRLTPLRKIGIGLFLMVLAFWMVARVQTRIDGGEAPSIGWQIIAYALLTASEVMVSIVGLEFSYTQAPRAMKSLIMSFFLLSVAVGNLFTAGVNHFIQLPDELAGADKIAEKRELNAVILPGHDNQQGTKDDIAVSYDEEFRRLRVGFSDKSIIVEIAEKISAYSEEHAENLVPSIEEAAEMIGDAVDTWGSPIQYTLVSSRRCRVSSIGPDKIPNTRWDMGIALEFSAPDKDKESRWTDALHPETPWAERRLAELKAKQGAEVERDDNIFVGGQSKLEGARYFWLFTWLMLGTAVIFVVVAKIYRPKEYLYEGEESDGGDEDGAAGNVIPVADPHGG